MRSARAIHDHNVRVSGQGTRPLVFAHGFGCDQTMWRHVAPAFEDSHRVVLFDHAGCGRAAPEAYDWTRHATIDGYADDVVALAEALDWRDMVFVGHSVSAMIGALASIRCPQRFARLVMLCPSPRYADDPPDYVGGFSPGELQDLADRMVANMQAWAADLARAVVGPQAGQPHADELARSFCAMEPAVARRFAAATFGADHRAELARVEVPTLVLQVAGDAIAPMPVGLYCQRQLPRGEIEVLPARGHCPHLTDPDLTIAAIRRHLQAGSS